MIAKKLYIIVSIIVSTSLCLANEWIIPIKPVKTVFFQGVLCSQIQASKYCGAKGFTATTGEHIVCPNALDLIYNPYIGCELEEVLLERNISHSWYSPMPSINGLQNYIFSNQRKRYKYTIANPNINETIATHAIDFSKLNIAQERDIAECTKKVTLCQQEHPDADIILWGVSRGAATVFNAAAHNHYNNVKLIVLEGCFDTVTHTLTHRIQSAYNKLLPSVSKRLLHALSLVTEFQPNGINPLASIDTFPENVPVVFITSKNDTNVSKKCTDNLVRKLRARGKNPVHYIILDHATHNTYALGSGPDQKKYYRELHTIYKQYGLPYCNIRS